MSKEQYADFHYLLALLKYDECKMLMSENLSKNTRQEIEANIKSIERIEKLIILDGGK